MDLAMVSFHHKRASRSIRKIITCLGQNTEKYITSTIPIEKEVIRLIKAEN